MSDFLNRSLGCTSLSAHCFKCAWKIEELTEWKLRSTYVIKSPIFLDSRLSCGWSLKLSYKNKSSQQVQQWGSNQVEQWRQMNPPDCVNENMVIFTMHCVKTDVKTNIQSIYNDGLCHFTLIIFDKNHDVVFKKLLYTILRGHDCVVETELMLMNHLFDSTKKYIFEETLILGCDISIINWSKEDTNVIPDVNAEIDRRLYVKEALIMLERCLKEDILTDVTLVTKDGKLAAHKIILCCKSPVFFAMFTNDMTENRENVVNINDFNTNVIKEMLNFVYTGKLGNIDDIAQDLLRCADKYAMLALKEQCGKILGSSLTLDNIFDIIPFNAIYKCKILNSKINNFVAYHKKDIIGTPNFEKILKSYPDIVNDMISKVLLQNQ